MIFILIALYSVCTKYTYIQLHNYNITIHALFYQRAF